MRPLIALTWASLLLLLPPSAIAEDVSEVDVLDQADACAMAEDYDCSFGLLIDLFEKTDVPFVDSEGYQVLTGSMLEASLILGELDWGDEQALKNARRYLDVVENRQQNVSFGFATGHAIIARSCFDLGEIDCAKESIAFLCANSKHWALPMQGHQRYEVFINQTSKMLIRECEVPQ